MSCREEKQISKQKKIQTFSRKNKYSCIIYNTRKKKEAGSWQTLLFIASQCNPQVFLFSCFFYFSAFPKPPPCPVPSPTLLSVGLLSPLFGPSPTTLFSVSPPFGSLLGVAPLRVGGPGRGLLSRLSLRGGTDFQSTPTRKKLAGTRRKNRKNLVGTYL